MASNTSLCRAAIVTGAAQGLGRAIALRLAKDGFDVTVNARSSVTLLESLAKEIREMGRKSLALIGDVSREEDVQMLVDRTVNELGELYVMVANAGILRPHPTVVDTSLDVWNDYLSVNLTGGFLCYRAAARQMLKQGRGGRIIGANSAYGKRGYATVAAYSATKFGLRGLTQALASELATEGITVNAYAPGFIETPLILKEDEELCLKQGKPIGTMIQRMKAHHPMARLGTLDEVAGLVSYFASDEAGFMTGQTVSLNGGMFYD